MVEMERIGTNDMRSKYQLPDIADGKWVYRGKRYCAFELSENQKFMGLSRDHADYLFYDKLDQCVLGVIKEIDKKYRVSLVVSSDFGVTVENLEDAWGFIPALADSYFKTAFS
jgi:hypothetical protein